MLVFIAALGRELSRLEPLVQVQQQSRVRGCIIRRGTVGRLPVALVQSGIGKERAREGALAVMETCRPEALISIGLAGGVAQEVEGGDLVLGERVYPLDAEAIAKIKSPARGEFAESEDAFRQAQGERLDGNDVTSDSALLEAATLVLKDEGIPTHTGDLMTVPNVMGPVMKKWLGTRYPVKAVEMESYWIGEVAKKHGVPFLAVRAVSDRADDPLPDYGRFEDEMGEVRPLSAALYFLTHPKDLLSVPSLARRARRASNNLGAFASLFFSKICGNTGEEHHE